MRSAQSGSEATKRKTWHHRRKPVEKFQEFRGNLVVLLFSLKYCRFATDFEYNRLSWREYE